MIKSFWVTFTRIWVGLLLFTVALSTSVFAQDTDDFKLPIEWEKRQGAESRLTVHGPNLMGDEIDPATGTLSFRHTDIDLPGNFSLPVKIERKRSMGEVYRAGIDYDFADWEIIVPKVSAKTIGEGFWYSGGARCSASFDDSFPTYRPGSFDGLTAHHYHNGISFEAPGMVTRRLLYTTSRASSGNAQNPTPQYPTSAKFVTTDDWYFECINISNGEGLKGHAPNGDVYRFDRVVSRDANDGRYTFGGRSGGSRHEVMLLATQVKDVSGNTVNYTYDLSGRLTQILSSDNRKIDITYNGASKLIASVTANNRTWSYAYRDTTFAEPDWTVLANQTGLRKVLSTVTQPDQKQWVFNLDGMFSTPKPNSSCPSYSFIATMNHPNGVLGRFSVEEGRYRAAESARRREWHYCPDANGVTELFGSAPDGRGLPPNELAFIRNLKVQYKELDNNGDISRWSYSYGERPNERVNTTKVSDPEGNSTVYGHYWPQLSSDGHLGGKMKWKERLNDGQSLLQREEFDWIVEAPVGSPEVRTRLQPPVRFKILRTKKHIIQDGDTYTTDYHYNNDQGSPNYSYGNPTQTKSYSNVSTNPRITDTEYEHNTSKWILGLPKKVTQNGREMATYDYDGYGRKTAETRYGAPYATYRYYISTPGIKGGLYWKRDALNRQTTFYDWKRGTPQKIKRPDNISVFQYVDDNGWVTSSRDALNRTTSYQHDNMGRLTKIDPPGSWANTDIDYDFSGGGAVQTITKGQSKQTITYDAMFRPILEHSQALDTGWSSYTNTKYDGLGRVSFKSQPSTNSVETKGTDYTYDGLGRIYKERENVTPYALIQHRYFSSHRHRVYDPSNAFTDYYSYGYDGPGNTDYRAIYKYANGAYLQKTNLSKNVHGQLSSLRQWGDSNGHSVNKYQRFYYDSLQRLCRKYVPEQGATKYQYDAAGQLVAYAKGQPNNNSYCGGTLPNTNDTVRIIRDQLGRVTHTNYIDRSSIDISRSYDPVSNLTGIWRGAANWQYRYNELDLPTSEDLTIDSRAYDLTYAYNPSGHMTRKTLPSGRSIFYTPDGLGRYKTIKNGSENLAANIGYHASGSLANMQFGNGQSFTQTLNARLLPQRLLSSKGGAKAIDQTLTYEARGKVTSIIDGVVNDNNRTYGYDGLGRVTQASGPWGSGSFAYDSTDNLRQKTLDDRTVDLTYDATTNHLTEAADTGVSGTRGFTYDARGNVAKITADACIKERELYFRGTGKTNWVHTAKINSCTNQVLSLVSTARNNNQTSAEQVYRFTDILPGISQSKTIEVHVISLNKTAEVQLDVAYSTGNVLTIRHRAKLEHQANWTPWLAHGSINNASPLAGCLKTKDLNYKGRGRTTWKHLIHYNTCDRTIASVRSIATNANIVPATDIYDFSDISPGQSSTVKHDVHVVSINSPHEVEVRAYFNTSGWLMMQHRARAARNNIWTSWQTHGDLYVPPPSQNNTPSQDLNFVYDRADQPIRLSGKVTGTYTYDGNLKRVKSVIDGKTIYNVYDLSGALVHVDAITDNKETDYVSGPSGPLARITNNEVTYLHPDHLGSAQAGTDASGAIIWREQYTPFGEELQSPAANDNLAGFTGHIKDKATGLNYMQARYYDPVIGRFLSIDPITFMDTGDPRYFNRYSYTANDPVNFLDPDGMVIRDISSADNTGRGFTVEAGDLSQERVNEIANQIPDGVFDALDGQDLSKHSVGTSEFNFKTDSFSSVGSEGQDVINIGNQIGTGLVPPSDSFPTPTGLVHAKTDSSFGQALTATGKNMISSSAVKSGITQVIATSIHERGHQGGVGVSPKEHGSLYRDVNNVMGNVGASPSSYHQGCRFPGAC